jgi:hypothetical protein
MRQHDERERAGGIVAAHPVVLVRGGAFAESAGHATKAAYPCLREVYV